MIKPSSHPIDLTIIALVQSRRETVIQAKDMVKIHTNLRAVDLDVGITSNTTYGILDIVTTAPWRSMSGIDVKNPCFGVSLGS
jgi:hypothetical protein